MVFQLNTIFIHYSNSLMHVSVALLINNRVCSGLCELRCTKALTENIFPSYRDSFLTKNVVMTYYSCVQLILPKLQLFGEPRVYNEKI